MHGVFPIWKRDTTELVHTFVELGFAARVCAVEGKLGPAFVGRLLDREFVAALPAGIDPCGEFGEFHSFVFDGPVFRRPVPVRLGQTVLRDTRHYVDLLPDDASGAADHSDRGPNASASNDSHQPSIPPV
jgi:diphthamide synthase (EF-2-diphthine--ammonia ligase)